MTRVLTCMEGTLLRFSPYNTSVRAHGMMVVVIPVTLLMGHTLNFSGCGGR